MAGRFNNSLRAVQKKLKKIVKDVAKSEGFELILESVDESDPVLEFMFEEDAQEQFGDNVHAFKAAADNAWIHCAKSSGLKDAAEQVSTLCTNLLRQEFPEMEFEDVQVSKKRGRASVEKAPVSPAADKSPPKKRTTIKEEASSSTKRKKAAVVEEDEGEEPEVTITSADKTTLKAIIAKLSKSEDAEYFLYAVDAKAYPEYYEQIAYPMDLNTAKNKLTNNEYYSVGEALADLRVIWENCRQFNAEGSDILNMAENCSALLESLVEEKFPSEVLPKKGKGGRKSKAHEEAPASVIKVEKNTTVSASAAPASAKKTAASGGQVKRKRANSVHNNTVVQAGWPVTPRTLQPLPEPLVLSRSVMKSILREIANSEFADPFLDPVDLDEAPGYAELIAQPMDLTTLRRRITMGLYDNSSAAGFVQDARLIWENCVKYNDSESDIALFAAQLGELFETQLGAVLLEQMEEDTLMAVEAAESAQQSAMKGKPGRKPKAVEEDTEDVDVVKPAPRKNSIGASSHSNTTSSAAAAVEDAEGDAKKPPSATMKKMRKIVREMYKTDLSLPFREPVPVDEVPGYNDIISNPMDLSTVKAQLALYDDAPGKFLRDMRLIFDNCQKFNQESSELYKNAGLLRDMVDKLYCEAFPPVDAAEEAAAAQRAAQKAARKNKATDNGNANQVDTVEDDYRPRLSGATFDTHSNSKKFGEVPLAASTSYMSALSTAVPTLPPPPSSGTSAAALSARLPTNPAELEALEKSLSDPSVVPSTNTYVRDRAALKARDKWKSTRFPYTVAPDLYVVQSLGELQGTFDKYPDHDATHLYPLGYSVSRKMRIALQSTDSTGSSDAGEHKVMPFIDVDLKCKIALSYAGNPDIFHVMLENGTAISQGATAREAWRDIIGKELPILHSLGGKLKRCRAVFNRLAVSPDALPFLDMVPHTGPLGEHYYNIIKSPMWFREVHNRLVEGTYDVEFDFAWDMRLIFKNCMEYNLAGSELYESAQRLAEAFEQLFTRWVLNVQDNSITDTAKGTWDAWGGLKYFDFEDPTVNICAVTGTRGPASHMLQCRCCEDQNLATLHPAVSHKNDWACPRCVEALAWCDNDLTNSPFSSYISPIARYDPYSIEEFGGNAYLPAPEFGQGWSQAKRRLGTGVKNLFLSPLGYEVLREQIPDQQAYENIVNTNLYAARAVEFTEYAKNLLQPRGGNKRKTTRHKRSAAEPMSPEKLSHSEANGQASSSAAPAADPAVVIADEEGRISTGKLHNYTVPEDAKLVWMTCANEALALEKAAAGQDISAILSERVPLTAALLPESGFFGLHLPAIRARLEGIPGAISCVDYRFQDEEKHRDDILREVRNIRKRQELLQASDNTLKKVLLEERFRYEMQLLTPPLPATQQSDAVATTMEHKKDFYPLFPPTVQTHQADAVLCLWEFMFHTPSLYKHIEAYSLHDLVCSLAPPTSVVTTYGQVVFDEVCCSLAEVLLADLRPRCDMTFRVELKWQQEVLMVRPVNILSWPDVALESLRLINFPLSMEEMGKALTGQVLSPMHLLQRDLLTLVFNHPLIDTFLMQTVVPEGHTGLDPNVVTLELRKMKDHFSDTARIMTETDGLYASVESLCAGVRQLFVDIATLDADSSTQRVLHARSIVRWFDALLVRWGVTLVDIPALPEDFPSMEDLSPALHAEKLNPWRFWGGYTLSNVDLPRTQLLLPDDLNRQEVSHYARRLKALENLEKTLWLLSRSEPEAWSADDRTTIYLTFIDHCIVSKEFITAANQRQSCINARLVRTGDISSAPSHVPHLDVVKHSPAGTKCHFTGVEVDHSLDGAVWVSVPSAYQNVVGAADATTPSAATASSGGASHNQGSNGGRGTRGSTVGCVALQSALLSVMAAREAAVSSAKIFETRVSSVLKTSLSEPPKTSLLQKQIRFLNDPLRSASLPSQPLGYDRHGNAYWLFSVQEVSTLFPFHPNGAPLFMPGVDSAVLTDGKLSSEPCVLLREPNGWWGVHNFSEINALLNSFSTEMVCERILLHKLIEKVAYARCLLHRHALNIRVTQREWVVKRIRAEHTMHSIKLPADPLAALQMTRFLETVWARCVEVRQYVHIGEAYRFEDDYMVNSVRAEKDLQNKRAKRLRELVGDDVFQLHHQKGWLRNDFMARVRQTAATTTATQIIADGTFYSSLAENSRKASFLLRNDPLAPPLSVMRAPLQIADAAPVVAEPAVGNAAADAMEVSEEPASVVSKPTDATESTSMDVEAAPAVAEAAVPVAEKVAESVVEASEPMEVEKAPAAPAAVAAVESVKEEVKVNPTVESTPAAAQPEAKKTEQVPVEDPESHLLDPNSLIPDLRAFINERCRISTESFKTKVIEMVHMFSGELIRVFQAGKEAATFLGVSQSGISLCLHNTKTDCYGFKWRLYDGPLITCWSELEQVQLPLSAVQQYQIKGKTSKDSWDPVEERSRVIRAVMEAKKLDPALYKKMPSVVPTATMAYVFKPAALASTPMLAAAAAVRMPPLPPRPVMPVPVPPKPAAFQHAQHVVLSNEVVSARLLRLKAELLNIFYIMPEKTLRLPELDEAGEKAIADAGAEAANNIRNGIARLSAAKPSPATDAPEAPAAAPAVTETGKEKEGEEEKKAEGETASVAEPAAAVAPVAPFAPAPTAATDGAGSSSNNVDTMSMSNVDRLADKAARKAKRRLRRKLSMDKFIQDIQEATTPQQLLEVTIILEGAIPQGTMYKYNRATLPMDAVTLATLARRIFALDRAIAYDEIKGVEHNVNTVPVRLRYQFYPRCLMSASCSKFCGHVGKCVSINDNGSRIPDFQDVQFNRTPGLQPYQYQAPGNRPVYLASATNMNAQIALANQRKAAYLQQLAALRPKDEDLPLEEIINKLLQVRKELDIENITPYCPPATAVTEFEWI